MPEVQRRGDRVRFGEFELDLRGGRLWRRGHVLRLRPQSIDVLKLLLERPGEVVTREELRQRLWCDSVFVDFERSLNCAVARLRQALHDSAKKPRFVETLPKRGYRFVGDEDGVGGGTPSLAVLPFANLNGDPGLDYFADGFTEALITELGAAAGLRVISRQSVLHLKGSTLPMAEIAGRLKVDTFLEGSVLREGPRVRICAQLIRMNPERHVWARTFETSLERALEAQRAIAVEVGAAVGALLGGGSNGAPGVVRRVQPGAYEDYLKGCYSLRLLSPQGYQAGLRLLESAIRQDPEFAPAYAALANGLGMASFMGQLPPSEGYGRAKPLAERALALNERLALAHASLALVNFAYDWDVRAAEARIRRAVELNPSEIEARFVRANLLLTARRQAKEAQAEGRRVLELDPLAPSSRILLAWLQVWSREFGEAALWAAGALEMSEDLPMAWNAMGWAHAGVGQYEEAERMFARAVALTRDPVYVSFLGHALARQGRTQEARTLLAEILSLERRAYVPSKGLAILHAGLGEAEQAIENLEALYEQRDGYVAYLEHSVMYDTLRGHLRFERLLRRVRRQFRG